MVSVIYLLWHLVLSWSCTLWPWVDIKIQAGWSWCSVIIIISHLSSRSSFLCLLSLLMNWLTHLTYSNMKLHTFSFTVQFMQRGMSCQYYDLMLVLIQSQSQPALGLVLVSIPPFLGVSWLMQSHTHKHTATHEEMVFPKNPVVDLSDIQAERSLWPFSHYSVHGLTVAVQLTNQAKRWMQKNMYAFIVSWIECCYNAWWRIRFSTIQTLLGFLDESRGVFGQVQVFSNVHP